MRKIKNKKKKKYFKDYKFKSKLVTYFINILMKNGKKNLSLRIFYNSLKIVKKKITEQNKKKISTIKILKKSLKNISPQVIIKNKKIGGSNYNIPIQISKKKKIYLAIKWLIFYSKKRKEKTMSKKLAYEIIASFNGLGESIKKKNDIHKIAESNKAFSYFKF
ncbi:MAG: 30S ribosomal protein S7 [Candidatus Shikimatogenerans bostrichidophilus]|nr:MAG: 30S ribosomal protein S7 [Candidatus Shikimatogenerans bostrichidophilus]